MEKERSLEAILQDLRRQEKHGVVFNQYHRQFLNLLRDAGWTASTKLPNTPKPPLLFCEMDGSSGAQGKMVPNTA
jgi:hypothetical protein